jgi:AAA family ATP:ADP antiporter
VNVASLFLQAFVVSRIVKFLGLPGALLALPAVALGTYGTIVSGAALGVIRWAKTAENATDYSVMNTARHILWLPTSRAEKYKAKQAADTFVVRLGDLASSALVFLGTAVLDLGTRGFAGANLAFIAAWILLGLLVLREHRALEARRGERATA